MRNYKNNILLTIAIMLLAGLANIHAQTITSVNASLDGAQISVTYDYTDAGFNIPRYIYMYMSTDGGTTFIPLSGLSGDIGGPMIAGTGKTIVWNILSDYPTGLTGVNATFEVRGLPFEIVQLVGGTFQMGCKSGRDDINGFSCASDESPLHNVTLSSYAIGKYEITNAQFVAFLNATGVSANGTFNDIDYGNQSYIDMANTDVMIVHNGSTFEVRDNSLNGTDLSNYPVIVVTWFGANAYAKWVGGRLPTEAEWEFAARGGNNSLAYQFSGGNTVGDVAWYQFTSNDPGKSLYNNIKTHPIGTKPANELGIYDMSGNASEWCQDTYSSTYYSVSVATNPQGPATGSTKLIRGASWLSNAFNTRIPDRSSWPNTLSGSYLGFRVVIP